MWLKTPQHLQKNRGFNSEHYFEFFQKKASTLL
jgi:hypothetical protein